MAVDGLAGVSTLVGFLDVGALEGAHSLLAGGAALGGDVVPVQTPRYERGWSSDGFASDDEGLSNVKSD